jgi:hypothetical protein
MVVFRKKRIVHSLSAGRDILAQIEAMKLPLNPLRPQRLTRLTQLNEWRLSMKSNFFLNL